MGSERAVVFQFNARTEVSWFCTTRNFHSYRLLSSPGVFRWKISLLFPFEIALMYNQQSKKPCFFSFFIVGCWQWWSLYSAWFPQFDAGRGWCFPAPSAPYVWARGGRL